jgi:hypothetical protein
MPDWECRRHNTRRAPASSCIGSAHACTSASAFEGGWRIPGPGHLISKHEIRPSAAIYFSLDLGIDVWVARFVYAYYRPD